MSVNVYVVIKITTFKEAHTIYIERNAYSTLCQQESFPTYDKIKTNKNKRITRVINIPASGGKMNNKSAYSIKCSLLPLKEISESMFPQKEVSELKRA